MCGIAGVIYHVETSEANVTQTLTQLQQNLQHRGPDEYGMHTEPGQGFLNTRLAIVGIADGKQPIYNTTKDIGIVYNGEVYNYQKMKDSLVAQKSVFTTNTDTEVILKAYERYGEDAFSMLEGMFAFCIWDKRYNRTYIVRDHFGIKPLYLYQDEEKLMFSSEMKAMLKLSSVQSGLDPDGVRDYFTFRYVLGPNTLFRNIRKLMPGEYLLIENGRQQFFRFADIKEIPTEHCTDFEEAKQKVFECVVSSVQDHLVGEVAVAMFLSGGVDSSIVAGCLNELGIRLDCYNVGFPEVNEFEYSSELAKAYGIICHNMEIDENDLLKELDTIINALDEPIADPACFPLYILSREVAKNFKVVLSGEGADELFCGYPQYLRNYNQMVRVQMLSKFLQNSYYFLDDDFLRQPLSPGGWQRTQKYFSGAHNFEMMSNFDLCTWIPDNLMMKADKITMQHSLEGRFPFLSPRIVSLVKTFPEDFFIGPNGESKYILKGAFEHILPKKILERRKMGFTVPIKTLLKAFHREFFSALNELKKHELFSIVSRIKIQNMIDSYYEGKNNNELKVWNTFILVMWLQHYEQIKG